MAMHVLGPFRLDTQDNLLFRGSEPVPLGQRAIALLRTLVERPGTLISKDALIEAAWSGRLVEENNLPVQITALRRVLGEAPGGDRWIETMPGRGYRFIGPVVTEVGRGVIAEPPWDDATPDPAWTRHDHAERRQPPRETEQPTSSASAEIAEPERPMRSHRRCPNFDTEPWPSIFVEA